MRNKQIAFLVPFVCQNIRKNGKRADKKIFSNPRFSSRIALSFNFKVFNHLHVSSYRIFKIFFFISCQYFYLVDFGWRLLIFLKYIFIYSYSEI